MDTKHLKRLGSAGFSGKESSLFSTTSPWLVMDISAAAEAHWGGKRGEREGKKGGREVRGERRGGGEGRRKKPSHFGR